MNDFTKDELQNIVRTFIVSTHNLEQEQRFKSGGIALPKIKNYEEYLQLAEAINSCATLPSEGANFQTISQPKIIYDIPERFRNE